MRLEHEFTYRTAVIGPHIVGDGPLGCRHCYEMIDGVVEGARLNGRTLGSGADWMLVGDDGVIRMDVRIQLRTDDGATLLVWYDGPARFSEQMRAALAEGKSTEFEDQAIRTAWRLECGDPRYAWVNEAIFVGEARVLPAGSGRPGFEHRIYRAA